MDFFAVVFILGLVSSQFSCSHAFANGKTYNVVDYGAAGDGKKDDSQAFLNAWKEACGSSSGTPKMIIPEKKSFLVNPALFSGPCKPKYIDLEISGTLLAPDSPKVWVGKDASQWLAFSNVAGLNVYGSGTIDGRGKGWWDQSCRYHPDLKGCTKLAPTSLKFLSCKQISLSNVRITNSPQTHVLVMGTTGMLLANLTVESPGDSPNTDGIHFQFAHSITVTNSKISSGDDCVSIGDQTSDLNITKVECGPGHGISIGSLGKDGNFAKVENIAVRNCSFKGTTNGARIKTWQVGRGYVRKINFENLTFDNVENPIVIDQNYCDVRGACKENMETGIQISDVTFRRFSGTSSTDVAINLNCSRSKPCTGIALESVHLEAGDSGKQVTAGCSNAHGREKDVVPGPCLKK